MARRQIVNRVGDLPTRTVPAVPEHLTMAAARKVAALKRVGLLFVERDGRLVGIVDERALAEAGDDAGVGAVMAPVGTCLHPAMPITRARDLFSLSRQSVLPVIVGAFLLGAVGRDDVARALARAHDGSRKRAPRFRAAA
ncbi:MAG TPA: CBS domain-containing protein [Polyangia bacterium]|jgi:CBS domain-containing protein